MSHQEPILNIGVFFHGPEYARCVKKHKGKVDALNIVELVNSMLKLDNKPLIDHSVALERVSESLLKSLDDPDPLDILQIQSEQARTAPRCKFYYFNADIDVVKSEDIDKISADFTEDLTKLMDKDKLGAMLHNFDYIVGYNGPADIYFNKSNYFWTNISMLLKPEGKVLLNNIAISALSDKVHLLDTATEYYVETGISNFKFDESIHTQYHVNDERVLVQSTVNNLIGHMSGEVKPYDDDDESSEYTYDPDDYDEF